MDSDEEDFVFVGTPIEREEELNSRKKKALAESSGHLRTLVPWKQEVLDEEGRRRFHGAFTGGFSAGYYNTVGSREGWAPQTFTSSRKNRADIKQQNILSFLDDDEKEEMEGNILGTSSQFDTFGFTAAEHARKQAKKEQSQRPSIIPGPVPDELVLPAAESIGAKLLLKMGWRHGLSIKEAHSNSRYDARREGRKALFAFASDGTALDEGAIQESNDLYDLMKEPDTDDFQTPRATPVVVREPKQDMHGLGYDPYERAPEFRAKKKNEVVASKNAGKGKHFSVRDDIFSSRSGKIAPGFGIGALEELDAEDEDVYGSGYGFEETYVHDVEEPALLSIEDNKQKSNGMFPRFRHATRSDHQFERFTPPDIPKDFVPHHKFPAPLVPKNRVTEPPPVEVPPPVDNNLRIMIDGVASLVARCGKLFEDLSREKNRSNPLFSFLSGGSGSEYYVWKLWEQQQKRGGQAKLLSDEKTFSDKQKISAESRGRILGEKPLERSSKESNVSISSADNVQIQIQLSDNFTSPVSSKELLEAAKPFKDDPAKQERFEQFLKDKYQGGLRSTYSSGASDMSEGARARERLDFEAAAEVMEKFKRADKNIQSAQQLLEMTTKTGLQFTSGGVEETGKASQVEELTKTTMYPKREEFTWRPAPLLCKRFDIIDPHMGKPLPAPRMKSKLDTLIFSSESAQSTKVVEDVKAQDITEASNTQDEVLEVENVERPVDLYKAIFSDDSEDEEEKNPNLKNDAEDPQKKIEAATATFSRLVAGDFLESLGKELGMQVPRESHHSTEKTNTTSTPIESMLQPAPASDSHKYETTQSRTSNSPILDTGRNCSPSNNARAKEDDSVRLDDMTMLDKKSKGSLGQHDCESNKPSSSSSSSEDERSKRSSRRRRRGRESDVENDDSSSDYTDNQQSSRSRSRKRRRSRERSHRKKKYSSSHRRSHKRSEEDSPGSNKSHRDREKDRARRRKEKLRRRE